MTKSQILKTNKLIHKRGWIMDITSNIHNVLSSTIKLVYVNNHIFPSDSMRFSSLSPRMHVKRILIPEIARELFNNLLHNTELLVLLSTEN